MNLYLTSLFVSGLVYLALLFLVAYATEREIIPAHWISHPWVYTLSLGVYATSWSYYGSVGFAASHGYQFLTIYLGVTLAFILSPVMLRPILRLTQEYQLSSLADLFAFRYRSQAAGVLVTLFMLVGILPYIALQIRAVTESLHVLTEEAPPNLVAQGFCITLTLFAILFGARHVTPREKHRGLVAAIAFESLVKLLALIGVGLFALYGVFGGLEDLSSWLEQNPGAMQNLSTPVQEDPWGTLILLSFAAAFLLPRQFQMLFAENLREDAMKTASWGFPLYLLLLNLFIPVLLWAGLKLGLSMHPDYFVLGIATASGSPWLALATFIGGISAASAMVIVTTLALSSMTLNHLLLPASYPDPSINLYYWLLWGRRLLIGVIILAGYSFYALLEHNQGLVQLGLISFVAVAQFLPGIIGLLYWNRATRDGFIAGLLGGILVWGVTLLIPLLHQSGLLASDLGIPSLRQIWGMDQWSFSTFTSLTVNGLLFALFSLGSNQRETERDAAMACCARTFVPLTGSLMAASPAQFEDALGSSLGRRTAHKEVERALSDLGLGRGERRPTELRRLRRRIETNLYGLIGPQLSHMIVNQSLQMDARAKTALAESMQHVEEKLEASRAMMDGLTMELDNLRRYQRQILLDLPLGVCAVSQEDEVVLWNLAMEVCSGINSSSALGSKLEDLPDPWNQLLAGFIRSTDQHSYRMRLTLDGRPHWFNLHKAEIESSLPQQADDAPGMVILLEDLTELEHLESELAHSDRLASIGRLAAGVAHEIGNPLTGIASLAQNIQYDESREAVAQTASDILTQTNRINAIVKSLMNFSRSSSQESYQAIDLCEILEEAMQLVRLTRANKKISIELGCQAGHLVQGDRQQLTQVLVNLLNNACDASKDGDCITINTSADDSIVTLNMQDQGCGIPDHFKERLFEPFATTKPTGQGTGLGLALARNIILDHGGSIEIESSQDQGTRVCIQLPAAGTTA